MKSNSDMSGGEKFAAAINDVWRFMGVALAWLWEHGGPFIVRTAKAIGGLAVKCWQLVFNKIADRQASRSNNNSLGDEGSAPDSSSIPLANSSSSGMGATLQRTWRNTAATGQNAWAAAKPQVTKFGESVKRGTASAQVKMQEASAEGGVLSSAFTKAQGWLSGGLPTVIGMEVLVLALGALLFWLFGRTAIFGYSWLVMIAGAVVAIAAMVRGYYNMNLEDVEGLLNPNSSDGGSQQYAVATNASQARLVAFSQMAFWCLIGVVAVIIGATAYNIAF